jgi:hypothetical protein
MIGKGTGAPVPFFVLGEVSLRMVGMTKSAGKSAFIKKS